MPLPTGSGLAGCVCGDGDATGRPLVPTASFSKVRRTLLDSASSGLAGELDRRLTASAHAGHHGTAFRQNMNGQGRSRLSTRGLNGREEAQAIR